MCEDGSSPTASTRLLKWMSPAPLTRASSAFFLWTFAVFPRSRTPHLDAWPEMTEIGVAHEEIHEADACGGRDRIGNE